MAIDPAALKKWAKGQPANAKTPPAKKGDHGGNPSRDHHDHDDGHDEEEGDAPRDSLWAGEEGGDLEEVVTPERAGELLDFLQEHEPEIYDAITELAEALESDDEEMVEHAKEELLWAAQKLNPEYPELTEDQRKEAGELIAKHMRDKGNPSSNSPEGKQAIAIGLSQARRGKDHDDGGGGDKHHEEKKPPGKDHGGGGKKPPGKEHDE